MDIFSVPIDQEFELLDSSNATAPGGEQQFVRLSDNEQYVRPPDNELFVRPSDNEQFVRL